MAPVVDLRDVVASRMRMQRKALRLTQAALAERAGVSIEMVSRIECGRCLPSLPTLVALARALECTPNDLTDFETPKPTRDLQEILALLRVLPAPRRRDIRRIAEALARYGEDSR